MNRRLNRPIHEQGGLRYSQYGEQQLPPTLQVPQRCSCSERRTRRGDRNKQRSLPEVAQIRIPDRGRNPIPFCAIAAIRASPTAMATPATQPMIGESTTIRTASRTRLLGRRNTMRSARSSDWFSPTFSSFDSTAPGVTEIFDFGGGGIEHETCVLNASETGAGWDTLSLNDAMPPFQPHVAIHQPDQGQRSLVWDLSANLLLTSGILDR